MIANQKIFQNFFRYLCNLKSSSLKVDPRESINIQVKKKGLVSSLSELNLTTGFEYNKLQSKSQIFPLLQSIFNSTDQANLGISFSILKTKFLLDRNEQNIKELFLQKIYKITSTIRLIDKICREKEGIGKNRAFQRWRLKSNYWFLKQHIEKIAINHKINGQVALWRLKKIKNLEVLNKNFKFLKNFNYFKDKLNKLHKNQNQKNMMHSFGQLKLHYLYQVRDQSFQTKIKFNDIFLKHFQRVSNKAFISVLNDNPNVTLQNVLVRNQKMKLRRVINSLVFFNRRNNLRIMFNFIEIFIKSNRKKIQVIKKSLKSPYEELSIKLTDAYQLKKRFFYRLVYKKNQLSKNLGNYLSQLIQNCNSVGDKLAIQNTFQKIQRAAIEQRKYNKYKKPLKKIHNVIQVNPCRRVFQQLRSQDNKLFGTSDILFERLKRVFKVNEAINKQKTIYNLANEDTKKKILCNNIQVIEKLIQAKKVKIFQSFFDLINFKKQKLKEIIQRIKQNQNTKKIDAIYKLKQNLLDSNKNQYYLKNIAKQLVEKHKYKVQQCYFKVKDPKWEQKRKLNSLEIIQKLVLRIQEKNKKNALKRLSYYSEAYMNRAFYIIKNLMMKKDFETLQENFYLLRACKDSNFQKYLENPKYLLQLVKMMKLKENNQRIFHSILVEPCYYMLKQNAGLLKKHELKHLENLMYLLKKKNRFHFKQGDIFQNKSEKEQSPDFLKMRNMFLEMIKQKVELIEKLQGENDQIKKNNEDVNDQIGKVQQQMNDLQKLLQQNQQQNQILVAENQNLLNAQKYKEQYSLENEIKQLKQKLQNLNTELQNLEKSGNSNHQQNSQVEKEKVQKQIQDSLQKIDMLGQQNKLLLKKQSRKKLLQSELLSLMKSHMTKNDDISKLSNFKVLINQNKSLLSELETEEAKVNRQINQINLQISQNPSHSNLEELQHSKVQLESNLKTILSKKDLCVSQIQEQQEQSDYEEESDIDLLDETQDEEIEKKKKLIQDELNQIEEEEDIKIYLKDNNNEISQIQNQIANAQDKLRQIEDQENEKNDESKNKKIKELKNVIKFNEDLLQKLLNQLNDIQNSLTSQNVSIANQNKKSKYDVQIQSTGEQLENLKSQLQQNDQQIFQNKKQIVDEKEDIKNALRQFEQFKILYSQRNLPIPPPPEKQIQQTPTKNLINQTSLTPRHELQIKQQSIQIEQLKDNNKKNNLGQILKITNKQKHKYFYKLKDLINIKQEPKPVVDQKSLKLTQTLNILDKIIYQNKIKAFNLIQQKSNDIKIRRNMASQFDRKSNQMQALHKLREKQLEEQNKKNQAVGTISRILDHHIMKVFQMGFNDIKNEVDKQTKNENQKIIFRLFNTASKFEHRKLRDCLLKWHARRNKNIWNDKILKNLIQKTQINSQIALWRMKICEVEKRYIDPHLQIGLIKIKNLFKRKQDENLILSWWAIEKKYQEMYTTNFVTNFETQMYQSIQDNLNQIYFTAISEKEPFGESRGPSLIHKKLDATNSKEDNLNPFYPQSSQGSVNALNKTKIGLRVLSQFFKRRNLNSLFDTLKIFNNSEYAQSEYKKSIKYSQPSFVAQQQKQIIKFLLEQVQINTSILKTQKSTIRNLEIDLKQTKDDEHYIKNHYHWVFLRRIQYVLDGIDRSNKNAIQNAFLRIKKQ